MVKSPEGVCNNASNGLLVETTRSVRLLKSGDGVFFNFLVSFAFCMYYIKKKFIDFITSASLDDVYFIHNLRIFTLEKVSTCHRMYLIMCPPIGRLNNNHPIYPSLRGFEIRSFDDRKNVRNND